MEQLNESTDAPSCLRQPGAILLISCYELGHQPIGIAQPMGFLEQAGFAPTGLDIAIDDLDEAAPGSRILSASQCPCIRRSGWACESPN